MQVDAAIIIVNLRGHTSLAGAIERPPHRALVATGFVARARAVPDRAVAAEADIVDAARRLALSMRSGPLDGAMGFHS